MPPVNPLWIKLSSTTHLFWYRLTGGFVGHRLGSLTFLLLTTTGRKSGRPRTAPLLYMADGENFVVVGSNGGNANHPAWVHNLRAHPEADVQAGSRHLRVTAREAQGEERARLWPKLVETYRDYASYQKETEREIPVVVLTPEGAGAGGR
jgi:deazaflavin-dependent oxidoreductase (nitroreductase family)